MSAAERLDPFDFMLEIRCPECGESPRPCRCGDCCCPCYHDDENGWGAQ